MIGWRALRGNRGTGKRYLCGTLCGPRITRTYLQVSTGVVPLQGHAIAVGCADKLWP